MTLIEFINCHQQTPFTWGEHDCCLFAAKWIKAASKQDFAADFVGRYKTAIGAKRLLSKKGFKCVADVATHYLGEPVGRLQLKRGDIVLIKPPRHPKALGIFAGSNVYAVSEEGLSQLPVNLVEQGWRLPCHQS
ncbi:hypothetical protein G3R49_12400 [Shewanella sp. WXL01]|uniref:DUF6950 family protein n=1 Tax=Shewanella sp. WXL01 TaxID=2709721 RepID=UPI0014384BF8|nr:hypothetical protein [Shewanella sp. WXL01]NKF51358.1 hypothetical protein [Shewanella sp. WXL01]